MLLGIAARWPVAWFAVAAGYLFSLELGSWGHLPFRLGTVPRRSRNAFHGSAVPLPTAYIAGLDYMLILNQQASDLPAGPHPHRFVGGTTSRSRSRSSSAWARGAHWSPVLFVRPRTTSIVPCRRAGSWVRGGRAAGHGALLHALQLRHPLLLAAAPAGLRCGPRRLSRGPPRRVRRVALGFVALLALEASLCAPWFLSFYNWPSGGPGRGRSPRQRLERGLGTGVPRAARGDREARHPTHPPRRITARRTRRCTASTTCPTSADPPPESEWIAVSSYYFVGLEPTHDDADTAARPPCASTSKPLWGRTPDARPARCMTVPLPTAMRYPARVCLRPPCRASFHGGVTGGSGRKLASCLAPSVGPECRVTDP
jgi:hypothetical protein